MAHVNNHQVHFRPVGAMSVIALVSLLALSACAGDDEDSAGVDPTSIDRSAGPPGADARVEAASADTVAGAASGAAAPESADDASPAVASTLDATAERLLVVDVTVALEVTDVGAALPEVIEVADRHDGLVYGSDITLDRDAAGDDDSRGTVTIKLPPAAVEPAIADLEALGDLVGRYQSSDDVTDRVTDVETRIVSAQQSVDRVQQMLAAATDLGEVVMLEGELTARQLVLEELLAAQRNLRNGTELATLTVDLSTAPPAEEPQAAADADDTDNRSIGDAFATGGRAFLTAITAALIFLGYVAPFLAVVLVVALVARAVVRRRPAREPSPLPRPTTPNSPTTPAASGADERAGEAVGPIS